MTNCYHEIKLKVSNIKVELIINNAPINCIPNIIFRSVYIQKNRITEINETLYRQIRKNTDD